MRAGLADGSVRIVVGTHAVLSDATTFRDLGLVVIDEEQRFGAAQKRKLHRLAQGVHTLRMTATPIPRTLQGAVAGLADISVLTTAPARRRPVRTAVAPADDALIAGALGRERDRGGRAFVVVPRVADIDATAARIARAAPSLELAVAHGDLPAHEVDAAMDGFARGEGDVLLATTIVESGLDVRHADTMLVLSPERFGLTQLHQLRGRVGRGARQAYCWLLTDPDDPPDDDARRRLELLADADALGAGFALAAADLDRRGGGTPFGDDQTGHGAHVGPALHAALLAAAIRRARGEPEPTRPEIHVDVALRLPGDYVPRDAVRASLYVRLARLDGPEAADALAREVEDRFGPPPPEARALLDLAAIRAAAAGRRRRRAFGRPRGRGVALRGGARSGRDAPWRGPQGRPPRAAGAAAGRGRAARRAARPPRRRDGAVTQFPPRGGVDSFPKASSTGPRARRAPGSEEVECMRRWSSNVPGPSLRSTP